MRAATVGSLEPVPTLVLDPPPADFEALLERRRKLGQDLLDEVWEGVYHMNPAPHQRRANIAQQLAELLGAPAREAGLVPMISIFNLGEPDDYRVPDGGLFRPGPDEVYAPTAELVVEIVSPGDESWQKLGFYADHGVGELLKTREGHHFFCYPFAGRTAHIGLGALLAWRVARDRPGTFSISMNDYGFELLCAQAIDWDAQLKNGLLSPEELERDILASLN